MNKRLQRFIGLFMVLLMFFSSLNTGIVEALAQLSSESSGDFDFIGYNSNDFPVAFEI